MIANASTISELRRSLINELTSVFSRLEAHSVARLILEHLGFPEISILKEPSAAIDYKIQAEIKKIVGELFKNRPIQYILGETEFRGIRLKVDKNVLIPRQETEELVSLVIADNTLVNPYILDIGTGSACIPIAIGKEIEGAKLFALDISAEALKIARDNARLNKVDIHFINDSIFNLDILPENLKVDILVSNPPYVTKSEMHIMHPNVVENEPGIALFVTDHDPLVFYREIIRLSDHILADTGKIWVEINEAFGEETRNLFLRHGYRSVKLYKDIHNKDRFIKASKSNE